MGTPRKTSDRKALPESVREVFAEWGRQGGTIRGKRMTKAQRSASARKAARARWEAGR